MTAAPPSAAADDTAQQALQAQRVALARQRAELEAQLAQLHEAAQHRPELQAQIRAATAGDANGRRRAALLKRVSLPTQATQLARLVRKLQQVIRLERQAWGLGRGELPPEMATRRSPAPPAAASESTEPLIARFAEVLARSAARRDQ